MLQCQICRAAAPVLLVVGALVTSASLMGGLAPAQSTKPAAPTPSAASAALLTCSIDDVHSMAIFRVQHMGAGAFWGRFNDVTGSFSFTPGSTAGMNFDISIRTESVDSGNDDLNKHLRSPDFFAAKDFPAMTFKSTSAKSTGDKTYELMGDLTIRGVTKPLSAKLEYVGMADMGRGTRAGFEATFTIKRSEFGVNYGVEKGAVGDEVRVIVGIEGIKKD